MIKRFLKDSFIYGLSNLISKCVSLFLLPIYIRVLKPEDYGIKDFLVVFFTLAGVFFSLEIYQAVARYYHEFNDEVSRKKSISTAFLYTGFSYLLFTSLVIIFRNQLSNFFFPLSENTGVPFAISLAAISTYLGVLSSFCKNILRYQLKSKIFALCSITGTAINITLSIFFVVYLKLGLTGVFLGQLAGNIITFIIAFLNTRNNLMFHFDFKKLSPLLKFSLPLVPSSIGVFLIAYMDRIVINYYLTLSDLGIYGVANRFASIGVLLMMSINTAITPLIYANYKKETTPNDLAIIFSYISSFIIIIVSGAALFSSEILYIFTTPEYYNAASLFPFLFLAAFLSKMYDFTPGLAIAKKTKIIAAIYFLGAILTLFLNIITIRSFGLISVAIVNCFTSVIVFIINYFFSQKYYYINYKIKPILLLSILCTIMVILSNNFLNSLSLLIFIIKTIIFIAIISLPFIFRIIDLTIFSSFIKKIKFK